MKRTQQTNETCRTEMITTNQSRNITPDRRGKKHTENKNNESQKNRSFYLDPVDSRLAGSKNA